MIAIEDPLTGEIACSQDGLTVDNCSAKAVKGTNQLFIRLIYKTDYTLSSVKKNLLLRTSGWVQRFPINVEINEKVIRWANHFTNFSPFTLGFGSGDKFMEKIQGMRCLMVLMTVIIATCLIGSMEFTWRVPIHAFPDFGV
jgi:hypothetical protein